MEGGEGHTRQRGQYLCESASSGGWDNGGWGALLAANRREWKRWLGRLIHGFVGQSENVALCSVSNRESSKVFIKAEE